MPVGASVQSGNVKITGTNTDHMIIDQSSNKSIINWNGFSIHKKWTELISICHPPHLPH